LEEVKTHNTINDAYIIVDNIVFDVTKFMDNHPGGKDILLQYLGTDASDIFYQ